MHFERRVLFVCLLLAFASLPAFSQVYKWRDKDGNLIVSSSPPPPGVSRETRALSQPAETREDGARKEGGQDVGLLRANRDIKAILYMTDWCGYCKKAAQYLDSIGVNWTQYDIEKNPDKNAEFLAKGKGGTGVPLIDIEGIILRGFGEESIKQAVNKRRQVGGRY